MWRRIGGRPLSSAHVVICRAFKGFGSSTVSGEETPVADCSGHLVFCAAFKLLVAPNVVKNRRSWSVVVI